MKFFDRTRRPVAEGEASWSLFRRQTRADTTFTIHLRADTPDKPPVASMQMTYAEFKAMVEYIAKQMR